MSDFVSAIPIASDTTPDVCSTGRPSRMSKTRTGSPNHEEVLSVLSMPCMQTSCLAGPPLTARPTSSSANNGNTVCEIQLNLAAAYLLGFGGQTSEIDVVIPIQR